MASYALSDGERARRLASFRLDGIRMNHDFAATPRHLIFFCAPVSFSLFKALLGRDVASSARFEADRGTEIVVVPIDDPSRIVRFTVPAFYMEHVPNAYELPGGEIAVDYTHYRHLRDVEDYVGTIATGSPKRSLVGTLRRAIVDPKAKTFRTEVLVDESVEMPRVSPLVEASKHRFAYCVSGADRGPWQGLMKLDAETGRVERYEPGWDQYPSEAVFVPKAGGCAEDDGWLLTLVCDAKSRTSHLQVLDASRFGDGPVARCHFDQIIPLGFHGAWAPYSEVALAR
jgi:all-trans-8'-apo-beta-carotenal 15,15'-oxygenase